MKKDKAEKLRVAIKDFASKYDSTVSNKEDGPSAEEQSENKVTKTGGSRFMGGYTEEEWRRFGSGSMGVS